MDGVFVDGFAVEGTDSAGGGLFRVGGAHDGAVLGDGAFAFEGHNEDGTGGDVGDKLVKEGLGFVDAVEGLGLLFGEVEHTGGDDFEASILKESDNGADFVVFDSVGFDDR